MAELKTQATSQDPKEFLKTIEPEQKRLDAFALLEMFSRITGEKPVMWGTSIIGFGKYHYESQKSTQKGDWLVVGFSPRKQNLTLYCLHGNTANPDLEKLGKHKASSGGCIYINKLANVDQTVLESLIKKSYEYMKKTHEVIPS